MKFNNMYAILILFAGVFCLNLHAMQPVDPEKAQKKKVRPIGPNVSPLLLTVLEKETERAHLKRIEELKQELPEKLNRLYALALPAYMTTENQQEHEKELDEHEQEALREAQCDAIIQLGQYQRYKFLVANCISFDELKPHIAEFKKSKGFLKKPEISNLPSGRLARFYAMYYALTNALKHIHWSIEPK